MPSLDSINYTLGILGILGVLGGWWATGRGRRRDEREQREAERKRREAADNAILGVLEVKDANGGVLQKKVPGLIERTDTLEKGFAVLVNQDGRMKSLEEHRNVVDGRLDGFEQTIGLLIGTTYQRGSEATLSAVEKARAGAIDVEPDQ